MPSLLFIANESVCATSPSHFSNMKFHVDTAFTGHEAIIKAQQATYDVALIDHELPDMGGIAILEKLTKDHPEIVCVMSSENKTPEKSLDAFNKGAQAYFTHPLQVQDISKRVYELLNNQQLLIKLKSSENAHRNLAESMCDLVHIVDNDGRFLFVNTTWLKTLNYTQQEVSNLTLKDIIHPESIEHCQNIFSRATSGERITNMAATFITKSGLPILIEGNITPCENNVTTQGIFKSISQEKQIEQDQKKRNAFLLEAEKIAHLGNWSWEIKKNRFYWSDEIFRIFEIDPQKIAPTYESFTEVIHPGDREFVSGIFSESVRLKTPYDIVYRLLIKDGRVKHVHGKCKVENDDNGAPIFLFGTVQDITEQVMIEEDLRRSHKMEAIGKLSGGIAHEYNNLLGIIIGYADLINNHLANEPKLEKYIQSIQHAGERGAMLTKKLLAFTRSITPNSSLVDINRLLLKQRPMLEQTLTSDITLELDLEENLWPAWIDSVDLEDTIINMSINATHAINGNGHLTLCTRNIRLSETEAQRLHLDSGDHILLSIIDNGCGMDDITQEKLFDPFYTTNTAECSGLGLSQVYGFVKRSSGAIKVESEPNHGSHFYIYFPRSSQENIDKKNTTPVKKQNLGGTETLLVVDDEIALVDLAKDILTIQGYRVLTANHGKQALMVLEQEPVDLIITDVIMPNMDGYQLAAQVQQRFPHIKIQMVSGFTNGHHNHLKIDNQDLSLLKKPYRSTVLLQHVRNLLDENKTKDRTYQ